MNSTQMRNSNGKPIAPFMMEDRLGQPNRFSRSRDDSALSQVPYQRNFSFTKTEAGESDFWDAQEVYDEFSNENNTLPVNSNQLTLRVINSSFVFGSLMLPYYMSSAGIILGSFIFFLIFFISFYQSITLLNLKSELFKEYGTCSVSDVFTLCGYTQTTTTVFRVIFILNSLLYLIILLEIFAFSIKYIVMLFITQQEWYYSARCFVLIGGILALPLNLNQKYPAQVVAVSRGFAIFAILMIVISGAILNSNNTKKDIFLLPNDFSVETFFSTLPSILIALAYHQQYFSGYVGENEKEVRKGSLLGALAIMFLELVVAIIGQIAFYGLFSLNYNNILSLTSNPVLNMAAPLQALFYTVISVSAFVQMTQYIPQCSQQATNVIKFLRGSKNDKSQIVTQSKLYKALPVITTIIVTLISYSLCSLSFLIILMGSITQNALSIQVPSILFLKRSQDIKNQDTTLKVKILFSTIILFVSMLVGFVSLIAAVLEYGNYLNN